MLGFSPISSSPLGSIFKTEFYIRGNSFISVLIDTSSTGELPIKGQSDYALTFSISSIGIVKVNRARKKIIAASLAKVIENETTSHQIKLNSSSKKIYLETSQKQFLVSSPKKKIGNEVV